jgi:protein SCO1/2
MTRRVWLAAMGLAGCAKPPAIPVLKTVPDFSLTDQNGQPFAGASLTGKIWVANFMFTSCTATCPRQSTLLQRLQRETAVNLISFTVDVKRDTPEVLAAYAKRFGADPARWHFLTGPEPALHQLAFSVFQVGMVDGKLEHSSRLLLVDAKRGYRGSYPSVGEESINRLLADIEQITKET